MARSVSKLMFTICLLVATFGGTPLRAGVDNWCSCSGWAYLYWESPQYGPYLFLDQDSFLIDEALNNPGPAGAAMCALECYGVGTYKVAALCGAYSDTEYPNQHYSMSFQYYFDDFENNYGGSGGDYYNEGTYSPLYCS